MGEGHHDWFLGAGYRCSVVPGEEEGEGTAVDWDEVEELPDADEEDGTGMDEVGAPPTPRAKSEAPAEKRTNPNPTFIGAEDGK